MTITPSSSSSRVIVAFCRLDLERFCKADPTREQVAVWLPLWCGYDGMTDDERAEVLAAYPVGDPEPVPGVDYAPEQECGKHFPKGMNRTPGTCIRPRLHTGRCADEICRDLQENCNPDASCCPLSEVTAVSAPQSTEAVA